MPARRQTGLDFAASALTRHVRALADRQQRGENGELSAADLASMVRAAEVLRAVECDRATLVLKVVGRRLATMKDEDLRSLLIDIVTGEIEDEAESAN
jgi:hypothetical protein